MSLNVWAMKIGCCLINIIIFVEKLICPTAVKISKLPEEFLAENEDGKISIKPTTKAKKPTVIKCVYCSEKFHFKSRVKRHVDIAHKNEETFHCTYSGCNYYFKTQKEKDKHVGNVHRIKINCPYCTKTYFSHDGLKYHVRKNHTELMIKCSFCQLYFRSQEKKEEHVKKVHKHLSKRSKCIYCDKFESRMYKHIREKHNSEAL